MFLNVPDSSYGNPSSWGASEYSIKGKDKGRDPLKDATFQIKRKWLSMVSNKK